jgi:hypothetical protein
MTDTHLKLILRELASRPHKALLICASEKHLNETRLQLEALAIPTEVDRVTRNLKASVRTMDNKVSTVEMLVLPNDKQRAIFTLASRQPTQVFTDEMTEMSLAQYAAIMERFPIGVKEA